jgi:hypothetical protein
VADESTASEGGTDAVSEEDAKPAKKPRKRAAKKADKPDADAPETEIRAGGTEQMAAARRSLPGNR